MELLPKRAMKCAAKRILQKKIEEKCFQKSTENLKQTKHSKATYFCIVYASTHTHLSNCRNDLILIFNEYQNRKQDYCLAL